MSFFFPQSELDTIKSEFGDADLKANTLGKQVTMLSQQLEESQTAAQDETKAKLAIQAKLRAAEDEKNQLHEALEDMEDMKAAVDKEKLNTQAQVQFLSLEINFSDTLFRQYTPSFFWLCSKLSAKCCSFQFQLILPCPCDQLMNY